MIILHTGCNNSSQQALINVRFKQHHSLNSILSGDEVYHFLDVACAEKQTHNLPLSPFSIFQISNLANNDNQKCSLFTTLLMKSSLLIEKDVDESIIAYYGRHGCKQHIHGCEPIRLGFLAYVAATRLEAGASKSIPTKRLYESSNKGKNVYPETQYSINCHKYFTSPVFIEQLTTYKHTNHRNCSTKTVL